MTSITFGYASSVFYAVVEKTKNDRYESFPSLSSPAATSPRDIRAYESSNPPFGTRWNSIASRNNDHIPALVSMHRRQNSRDLQGRKL